MENFVIVHISMEFTEISFLTVSKFADCNHRLMMPHRYTNLCFQGGRCVLHGALYIFCPRGESLVPSIQIPTNAVGALLTEICLIH